MSTMAGLLNKALNGKKLTVDKKLGTKVVHQVPQKVNKPFRARAYHQASSRWFAFDTSLGRVARQTHLASVAPHSWKRVGDQNGYKTPLEAMKCSASISAQSAIPMVKK